MVYTDLGVLDRYITFYILRRFTRRPYLRVA